MWTMFDVCMREYGEILRTKPKENRRQMGGLFFKHSSKPSSHLVVYEDTEVLKTVDFQQQSAEQLEDIPLIPSLKDSSTVVGLFPVIKPRKRHHTNELHQTRVLSRTRESLQQDKKRPCSRIELCDSSGRIYHYDLLTQETFYPNSKETYQSVQLVVDGVNQ